MKYLFLILLTTQAMASNWMPISKIQSNSIQAFQLESDCKKSGEQCLDVGANPEIVSLGFVALENDWGPEVEPELCEGQSACEAALESKVCEGDLQKFIDAEFTHVYCIQLLGKKMVIDNSAFSAYQAAQVIIAQEQAAEQNALARMACGQKVIAKLLVRNASKQLTQEQVGSLSQTYAPIQGLLLNGSLETAKSAIQAVQPDGVIVTEADQTALVEKLDSCKPQ